VKTLHELSVEYCSPALSDKGTTHSYIDAYMQLFEPLRSKPITLLEVGVKSGASIKMWQEYFSTEGSKVIGVDVTLNRPYQIDLKHPDIQLFLGNSTDAKFMAQFNDIDIFIDDGSHYIDDQIATMQIMLPRVKTGGVYVIEDVGYQTNAVFNADAVKRLEALNIENGKVINLNHERPDCHCNVLFVVSK
jgi:cephalosporin hydroxylase